MSGLAPAAAARRPNTRTYPTNATSATAPMLIRAQAGSGEGVTNASITPETSSTTIKPSAIVSEERPSSASARPRGRGPGSMMLQPRRSPAAAARNTA